MCNANADPTALATVQCIALHQNSFIVQGSSLCYSIITLRPPLGSILLHAGDLQHLSWLGLQWTLLAQRPALRDWLQQLFPRLTLETSKLDTNTPESICLLDLEVCVALSAVEVLLVCKIQRFPREN